jgi:carbon-monoxide dehydrogenase large subunit
MVRSAVESIGHNTIRQQQRQRASSDRSREGVGYAFYIEQTAHGAEEWRRRGASIGAGFESARVRLHPTGTLTIDVGIQSHGQGLETTLAQIASDVMQIPYDRISVRHGDTEISPYGLGTVASRSVVMAGGATHKACTVLAEKVIAIGAALLGCLPEDARLEDECVAGSGGSVSFADIANAAYLNIHLLPKGVEAGLESFATYRPSIETGAFSAGLHAAKVSVDLDTGHTCILDYTIVEDCGRVVNPMIVDGQMIGGLAQGIGQALYEELRYTEMGQPKNVNFADYILPGPTEVPSPKLVHQETLSPFTVLGIKGTGEGGCIAPPAAIANAVVDALKEFSISVDCTPISAASVWTALEEARGSDRPVVVRTREILE